MTWLLDSSQQMNWCFEHTALNSNVFFSWIKTPLAHLSYPPTNSGIPSQDYQHSCCSHFSRIIVWFYEYYWSNGLCGVTVQCSPPTSVGGIRKSLIIKASRSAWSLLSSAVTLTVSVHGSFCFRLSKEEQNKDKQMKHKNKGLSV